MPTPTPVTRLGGHELYPDTIGENSVIDQVWNDIAATSDRADPVLLGEFAHDVTRCSVGFLTLWKIQSEIAQEITDTAWETLSANTSSPADLGRAQNLARALSWNARLISKDDYKAVDTIWTTRRRQAAQSIATLLAQTSAIRDYIPDLTAPGNMFNVAGELIHSRVIRIDLAPQAREPFIDNYIELGIRATKGTTDTMLSAHTFQSMQDAVRHHKPEESDRWERFAELDILRYSATGTRYAYLGPRDEHLRDPHGHIPLIGWVADESAY